MDLQLGCQSSTVNIMSGVPGKAIPFRSVTVYSKNLSSQYNLPAQIEQVKDKDIYVVL